MLTINGSVFNLTAERNDAIELFVNPEPIGLVFVVSLILLANPMSDVDAAFPPAS